MIISYAYFKAGWHTSRYYSKEKDIFRKDEIGLAYKWLKNNTFSKSVVIEHGKDWTDLGVNAVAHRYTYVAYASLFTFGYEIFDKRIEWIKDVFSLDTDKQQKALEKIRKDVSGEEVYVWVQQDKFPTTFYKLLNSYERNPSLKLVYRNKKISIYKLIKSSKKQ